MVSVRIVQKELGERGLAVELGPSTKQGSGGVTGKFLKIDTHSDAFWRY